MTLAWFPLISTHNYPSDKYPFTCFLLKFFSCCNFVNAKASHQYGTVSKDSF